MDRTTTYELMLKLYNDGKLDKDILRRCVEIQYELSLVRITKEEYRQITGEKWSQPDD